MQIVIEIPESLYNAINQDIYINGMRSGKTILQKLVNAIANGTVLPEHGRLIDADELEELFREVISHLAKEQSIHIQGALEHMVRASAMTIEMITDAPTILEAWGNEE